MKPLPTTQSTSIFVKPDLCGVVRASMSDTDAIEYASTLLANDANRTQAVIEHIETTHCVACKSRGRIYRKSDGLEMTCLKCRGASKEPRIIKTIVVVRAIENATFPKEIER